MKMLFIYFCCLLIIVSSTLLVYPEILLVGTGKKGLFPPPGFKKYLNGLGIQVDVLDSVRFLHFSSSLFFEYLHYSPYRGTLVQLTIYYQKKEEGFQLVSIRWAQSMLELGNRSNLLDLFLKQDSEGRQIEAE